MRKARPFVALLLVALVLGGASWLAVRSLGKPDRPEFATVLAEPRPLPEFSLVDQSGAPFTRERLLGTTSLMFFGFTHCPDICPATLAELASAREQLAASEGAEARLPQIVFVSVDPERDTPEKLAAYVGHFGDGFVGVTGSEEQLRALAQPLGIWFEKEPLGEDYSVSHSAAVLFIDGKAELRALFGAPHRRDSFVHDVPLLVATR